MRQANPACLLVMVGLLMSAVVFGQIKQPQVQRRPPANASASETAPPKSADAPPSYDILDGLPILLTLDHDTEVGTNKPVDVYVFVIEMQIMNSDGNPEPVGLQIFNFYTAHPQDAKNDVNPHNARDCRIWAGLQTKAMKDRNPKLKTWPYVEFITTVGARVLQTNEDGPVWWSDDIQCWGSSDRFSPF